ncbi:MFS transporter [Thiotrichales bacterium 19S9-12]|nr:MFS transporter [Thiotrichales bacterium 19S9-11]MCF6812004.1 MFS transporter [Thiotrichales bacterium 19S9-12]
MNVWKISILLSYISIASASAAIITPALPNIQVEFSATHGLVEWTISIFLLGYMLGQLFYGPLANILGRLTTLRLGLIINLVGIIICILSVEINQFSWLLVGRFVTAVGASSGLACTFMILNEALSPQQSKSALSFAAISFTAGIGLAVLAGGLVTFYLNWHYCFFILFIHGVLVYLSTYLFSETLKFRSRQSISKIAKSYCLALIDTKLLIFSLAVGSVSVFSYCFSAAAPFIAQNYLKITAFEYSYWNMLNMLGMIIGSILASRVINKYTEISMLIAGLILLIFSFIIMSFLLLIDMLNSLTFFSMTALAYACGSLIFPAASHIASNAITCRANASGAMNFINMGSAVFIVSIMGYLPVSPVYGFILIVGSFSFVCLLFILAYAKFNTKFTTKDMVVS